MQHVGRQAGGVEQPHRLGGDQRRLLGGLGDHGIARRQRRGDLAGEDGEREIPGLMQAKTPRPCSSSALVSPTGPFQSLRAARSARSARSGVVAAEVGRLAHLADRVGQVLPASRTRQRDQAVAMLLPARRPWRAGSRARPAPPRASQPGCAAPAAAKAASIWPAGLGAVPIRTDRTDFRRSGGAGVRHA